MPLPFSRDQFFAVFAAYNGESYADIPTVERTVGFIPRETMASGADEVAASWLGVPILASDRQVFQDAKQIVVPPTKNFLTVDIKPGSSTNKVNLASRGLLPVAVLSTAGFDATLFTPEMAHLSDAASGEGCTGAMAVRWSLADVNNDGSLDLVFFFRVQDLGFTTSTTAATFMAHGTYDGMELHIMGTDTVLIKP